MRPEIHLKKATEFSNEEIAVFKETVLKAGEVSEESFDNLMAKNPFLLFLGDTLEPTGVAALKIPFDSYKQKVFTNSESAAKPVRYTHELGWVVSRMKGNGNNLMIALLGINIPMYATVREENLAMIHLLKKYGFTQQGNRYKSDRDHYYLLLFTR